jgi:hypothetical protein
LIAAPFASGAAVPPPPSGRYLTDRDTSADAQRAEKPTDRRAGRSPEAGPMPFFSRPQNPDGILSNSAAPSFTTASTAFAMASMIDYITRRRQRATDACEVAIATWPCIMSTQPLV